MDKEYKEIIKKVVNEFIEFYRKNPFNFLYEADIQGMLFTRLYDAFKDKKFQVPLFPEKIKPVWDEKYNHINPVKTQFPCNVRFDICVLNKNYDDAKVREFFIEKAWDIFWHIPPKIILEIKYCQHGDSALSHWFKVLKNDLIKINKYSKDHSSILPDNIYGSGLLFVQKKKYVSGKVRIKIKDILEDVEKLVNNGNNIHEEKHYQLSEELKGWIILPNDQIFSYEINS